MQILNSNSFLTCTDKPNTYYTDFCSQNRDTLSYLNYSSVMKEFTYNFWNYLTISNSVNKLIVNNFIIIVEQCPR